MLIYANIINNQLINYVHQRAGNFFLPDKIVMSYYGGSELYSKGHLVKDVHEQFLESVEKNQTDKWKKSFEKWYFLNN